MSLPRGAETPETTAVEWELEQLKRKIERERGFQCQHYKGKCLRRRIAVRMRVRGVAGFADYAALLDRDPLEYDVLLDALTINVSKFFRNAEVWDELERGVVPALFARPEPLVRVWSAGSAAGEEAYSLAILLQEHAERSGRLAELRRFRIVGTDIDHRSLELARRAEYPELALGETSAARRTRWFTPAPPHRLHDEARRRVGFRRHDLLADPPEAGQSLILCRNVIIYFEREVQERLFQRFHDALLPGGFLVLGKVETLLGGARALYHALSHRDRIFQRPP